MNGLRVTTDLGGSDAQFRQLFDKEYDLMVQIAFRIVSNRHEAEEVAQDAFAEVYRRWTRLLNPGGYLRTTTVNGARNVVRRRLHRDELHNRIGNFGVAEPSDPTYLFDVLDRLPERQRTALVLAYFADMSRNEIADCLGCRPGTAKSLVHRGLKRMQEELNK